MRRYFLALLLFFAGCASEKFGSPPAVASLPGLSAGNVATFTEGRTLFTTRCLECHTLPPVKKYPAERWPHLVAAMAARAELNKEQEAAVVAYLHAAAAR